jgi:isocitrate/isopropylmalate dehydrogenase
MAAVLSAGLLLERAGAAEAAARIDAAVDAALEAGVATPDVGGEATTAEVGEWIASRVAGR